MNNIIKTTLGDIGKVCMCKRILKEQTSPKEEIPFFKISTFGGTADTYISRELYETYKKKFSYPKNGDILISAAGTLGRTVIFDGKESFFQDSNIVWIDNDESKVLNSYLYYFYKIIKWKKTTGSTIDRLYNENITGAEIFYPEDIEEQRKIVSVLKSFDDKIKNNNDVNAELKSMAKTIYDYWFLQFEFPDENGKPYKSSGGKMVWNDELKRDIPDGWEPCHIRDCIKHINTGLNPRDNFKLGKGSIRYITVKNLTTNGTIDFTSCDVIDEEARVIVHRRSDVSKGDILFASIAPLGRCVIVQENPVDWDINESVFSIRPDTDKVSTEHLYMFFMSDYFIKKAEHNSTGSVFSGIRVSTLEDMYILLPPPAIRDKFKSAVADILYKKYLNDQENQELASLRDFLLPLLMNGQVTFGDR